MSRLFLFLLLLTVVSCGYGKESFTMDGQAVKLIEVNAKAPARVTVSTTERAASKPSFSTSPMKSETSTFPVTITPRVKFDPSVLKKGYRKSSATFSASSSTLQSFLTNGLAILVLATIFYLLMGQGRRQA